MIYKLALVSELNMSPEHRLSLQLCGSEECRIRTVNAGDLGHIRKEIQKRYGQKSIARADINTEIYLVRGGIIFLYDPGNIFPRDQRVSVEFVHTNKKILEGMVNRLSLAEFPTI